MRRTDTMEPISVAAVTAVLSMIVTGVSSLQCYQCHINPPPGHYYNTTKRLCMNFDYSKDFIVDCPYSTFCVKQEFYLNLLNGERVDATLRDCAPQKHEYQDYKNGQWSPKMEILEPYREGCEDVDDKGQRTTPTRYCYCRSDLCNSSPTTNHEGYTDIMGVIVVFNLMKYINSLR
ncbi:uncharacterized protein LOC126376074 [Pectinophora gossypiella]|uniref:Protein sleepless n=1 Tax=Pectinophora gossypiella TaxID=13191 RepID=A0A1E1WUT8_PECGO|nr:uncharacterized protein LOC126376074 [Pectinophora gossypiella]